MTMLIAGVLLFAGLHFIPSLGRGLREAGHRKFGENGYKGVFSLALLASFALIIFGWRSAIPAGVYMPPPGLRHPAMLLVAIGFFLFIISNRPSKVRQWIRHPQLTGVILWAIAHLLMNGDSRSVILFGGLGLWALLEIFAINRRDGEWVKDEPPGIGADVVNVVVTVVVVAVVMYVHPWIAGVAVL